MQRWKTINIAKKLLLGISSIFICFCSTLTFGDYDDFLGNLRQLGIDVDSILKFKEIDRYELTRLLNGVNCKDCIHPDSSMTSKYTYQRRSDFSNIDGNAFNDITYLGGSYKGQSYYYCVAYVGDNLWMRGYPNDISPICNGKFCGTRTTTLGEFLQVVVNIADQYIYHRYLVDWKKIKTWMDGLPSGSYADTYLTNDEKFLINKNATNRISGPIPDEESFQAYLKYCMFNLKDCGMQSFGAIGQGYWPVAELNVLYDNNIVEYTKFADGQTNELVDGNYVLETLYNLFQIIDCSFNYDYDCDSLINKNDNCPNYYNPTQTDTDGDGIGDVCDDDIDGDGVKNPIGIIDDLGNVIVSKYKDNMDNCLFVPNHQQTDSNLNGLGNECDKANNSLGMYIKVSPIRTTAPATASFEAVVEGNVKGDFNRSFGDGSTAQGKKVSHTFEKFGLYTVQVTVNGYSNNAKASTTVLIGNDPQNNYALQLTPDKQQINAGEEITFNINKQGSFDKFQRNFGDGNSIEQNSNTVKKRFRDEGIYMVTVKGFKDGKIVAVANTIVGVGNNTYGSKITSNKIFVNKGEKIILQTNINGFTTNDIVDITRDFGDTKTVNNDLTQEHTYSREGTYVITQRITLKNGATLNNFTTISVGNQNIENSYAIETSINKLVSNSYEDIGFTISDRGTIPNVSLVLNSYNDGYSTKSYDGLNTRPKAFSHQYSNGIYSPKNTVYVDDCIALSTEATIVIDNGDICLKALLDGTLKNIPGDMDGDGIPDICDDDIDGDGYPNLIGMINPNKTGAEIKEGDISATILKLHKGTCQLDNCPTVQNQNQLDLNNNGWGDACDNIDIYQNIGSLSNSIFMSTFNNIFNHANNDSIDTDGDGISDSLDACPGLPENYNGVQDFDGCPEILAESNCALTNYNYINQNFSVYPSIKTGRIHIIDPINPEPGCKGDDCKNLCLGSINNCVSCNGKENCTLCEQAHNFCGDIDGGTGPYTITAWCVPENIFHVWHDVSNYSFNFADTFKGTCPCKKCHRFVKDVNGLISNIGNFSVCNPECIGDGTGTNNTGDNPPDELITRDPEDIIPPCKGSGCNVCEGKNCNNACIGDTNECNSCNGNKNCEICKQSPETCGTRSGGQGPYELEAWCEDETSKILRWDNITDKIFSFSEYFELKNSCRDCHRIVSDSKGLTSPIGDFQVCPGTGEIDGPNVPVTPSCLGPNCIINQCTGNNCHNCIGDNCVCVGDIQSCPDCPDPTNPACNDDFCTLHPESCGCRSGWDEPVSISARCESNPNNILTRDNLTGSCLSFDNIFPNLNPNECDICHRDLTDSNGITSETRVFNVCNGTGEIDGPDVPVPPSCVGPNCIINQCTGSNCTNCTGNNCVCIGDIQSCPDCPDPTNPACNDDFCTLHPESCGCRSGRDEPVSISARCESNPNNILTRDNLTGSCLSFDNIFPNLNPNECDICHRDLTDSNGITSETRVFNVCNGTGEVDGPIGPVPPSCVGPNCTINQCTGNNCTNCTGNNSVCVGDIQSCPDCPNPTNPACDSFCTLHPESCGCRSGWDEPVSISARCESDPNNILTRNNLTGSCLSFDSMFPNLNPNECDICHRNLTDFNGTTSETRVFDVCSSGINIIDPERPEYTCTGDNCTICEGSNCHDVCIGNIDDCDSCNGDPTCELCKKNPELCGTWSGGQGPYEIQARCDGDLNNIYTWYNVIDTNFSFNNIWTGECPCKSCNRKIKDSNGLVSDTGNFYVCAEACNEWIEPIDVPDPTPNCEGDNCDTCTGNVNNCPCKDNPNCPDIQCKNDPSCTSCRDDPDHSASWTGTAKGPYSITARCDDDGKEFTRNNISGHCFNLSGKFKGTCEERSCHRSVSAANGITSTTSDFTVEALDSNKCIIPSGPDNPTPGCTGDKCIDVCKGDLTKCPCENNPSCSAQECKKVDGCTSCDDSDLSATRETELEGPYDLTARCPAAIGMTLYKWTNIKNSCLSLVNVFEGDCPCKTCFRYVETSNGETKSITMPFQVCDTQCGPDPWIEPIDIPDPTPNCEGDNCDTCTGNVNNCPCKDNPNCPDIQCKNDPSCTSCKDDPDHSASWTGTAKGPYSITARCDDDGKEFTRNNISGHCFNLSGKFKGTCEERSCHRFVSAENGITSETSDFTVEPLNSNKCITPSGPDVPIPGCADSDCEDVCMGDITKCPCENNPSCSAQECEKKVDGCDNCENSELSAKWKSHFPGPFTVTVKCEKSTKLYIRSNLHKNCMGLSNIFEASCPCNICQRSVSVKRKGRTISTPRNKFQVCKEGCEPDPGVGPIPGPNPIIPDGPDGPTPCEGSDCNNCVGNVNNCNILCTDNQTSNGNNISWTGGVGPYMVTARCDGTSEKQRTNISGQCLTLEKQFEGNCPCNQCHWFVQDSNGDVSDILDFQVCKEECEGGDEPTTPTPLPDGPITIPECLACPCNYTDFGNTLSLNDDVKAILLDLNMATLYSESIPVGIMQYLNQ